MRNGWVVDWFPLSGSLGSDAQALPVASRSVHVCPRCLFAVHYLPLALISLDGWPALFQSTSVEFRYELVRDLIKGDGGAESRVKLKHFDTPGTKEGSRAVARRLMAFFERIQEANRFGDIARGATLLVWRFKNSGASPDCQIDVISQRGATVLVGRRPLGIAQGCRESHCRRRQEIGALSLYQ